MPVAKDLTELVDIDPLRVDLVRNPANGFPILIMKALGDPAGTAPEPTPAAASDTDATKETSVPEPKNDTETSPATEPEQTPEPVVEKSAAELVQEEVAKAVQPLNEVIKGLRDEMAALKSTPIPGGPVITSTTAPSEGARAEALAKAAYHDRLAGSVSDRDLVRYHEEKAAEARKAAKA